MVEKAVVHIDKKLTQAIFKIANTLKLKKSVVTTIENVHIHSDNEGNLCATLNDLFHEVTIITKQKIDENFYPFLLNLNNRLWNKFKDIRITNFELNEEGYITKYDIINENIKQRVKSIPVDEFPYSEFNDPNFEGELIEKVKLNIEFPVNDVLKFYTNSENSDNELGLGVGLAEDTIIFVDGVFFLYYSTKSLDDRLPTHKIAVNRNTLRLNMFKWTEASRFKVYTEDIVGRVNEKEFVVINGEDSNFKYRIVTRFTQRIPEYSAIFNKTYNELDKNSYIIFRKFKNIDDIMHKDDYLWITDTEKCKAHINFIDSDDYEIAQVANIECENVPIKKIGIKGSIFNILTNIARSHKNLEIKLLINPVATPQFYYYSKNGNRYALGIFLNARSD